MDLHGLESKKKRVQQVNEALITKVFTFYMLRDKQHVIDFVKQRWKKGERPDGSIIGTYAWVEYEMFKRQRNPLADGNVDLIDTGSLMEGIDLIPRIGANFSIFSTDAKFLLIVEQYGLDVFALTEEEQKVVIDIVQSETNMALYRYVIDNDSLPI